MSREIVMRGAISILVLAGCVFTFVMAAHAPRVHAQTGDVCHAAMVFDRSASVGERNLETMRQQVLRLFQPTGLYNDNIRLAFWSFSAGNGSTNYNAPFNGYVSSRGINNGFWTNLNRMVSSGATNYEQGFGYHRGVLNSFDDMTEIINQTNIIVFMTDGLPNVPGSGQNNQRAREAGRNAVLKHKQAGRFIIGGLVGNSGSLSGRSLNYVLNGSDSNSTNTFRISSDYSDLSRKLREVIGTKCDELFPPEPDREYSLRPTVIGGGEAVSSTGSATLTFSVNNSSTTDSSDPTDWTIKRIIVPRGQSDGPLHFGKDTYRDGYSCEQLENLVNNPGTCEEDVLSGKRVFVPGHNSMEVDTMSVSTVKMKEEWGVGTKVCYFLTIAKPTHKSTPVDRFSEAACITVGKYPMVQVHGGDIWSGRKLASHVSNPEDTTQPSRIMTSKTLKGDGKTYGSWAEYGVFAAGDVSGFASMSGLAGGSLSEAQATWSELTFANTDGEFGRFTKTICSEEDESQCDAETKAKGSLGTMPDTVGTLLALHDTEDDHLGNTDDIEFDTNSKSGLYEQESGDLKVGSSELGKGQSIIIYVPDGTVTITDDLKYMDGPYTSIDEIPQMVIIAKRIVIKEAVTQVDAWLIADDDEDGSIVTCDISVDADGNRVSYEEADTLTSEICNKQLTINGPVMARNLELRRTGGAGRGGASGDPAEIINMRADAFLWAQSESRNAQRIQTTFATELPPYF